jgi:hypothetical protein
MCLARPALRDRWLFWQDRDGKPADADQLFPFVRDADLPDLRTFANVNGPGSARDKAFPDAPNVIGVDLQTDGIELAAVDDVGSAYTAEGLGEGDGGAPMQETIGLPGSVIHGHATFEKVFPYFNEFDPEMLAHGIFTQRLDMVNSQIRLKPNRHILVRFRCLV